MIAIDQKDMPGFPVILLRGTTNERVKLILLIGAQIAGFRLATPAEGLMLKGYGDRENHGRRECVRAAAGL